MSNVEFHLDLAGLSKLMKSKEMQGVLTEAAEREAEAMGPGWHVERGHPIRVVAIAAARPDEPEDRQHTRRGKK